MRYLTALLLAVPAIAAPCENFPCDVSATWDAVPSASHYQLFNGGTLVADNISGTSYVWQGGAPGLGVYCLTLIARNGPVASPPSEQACVALVELGQPLNLRLETVAP